MNRETPVAMKGTASLVKGDNPDWIPGGFVLRKWPRSGIASSIMSPLSGAILLILLGCLSVSAYTDLGNHVLQSNGSASDTQAAINAATDGTIIQIPNGSYTWNQQVTNNKNTCIHLLAQSVGGVTITRAYTGGHLIILNASLNGYVELGGIKFTSNLGGSQDNFTFTVNVNQLSGRPVLIHDCSFVTGYEYAVQFQGNGGVVWNCSFATYSDQLGGITFVNTSATNAPWNTPDTMGGSATKYGPGDTTGTANTYIEDCLFQDMDVVCTNFDDNSRCVVRYSTLNNAALGSHGQETSIWGARHWEIYNNTFNYSTSGRAFGGDPYPLNMNTWFGVRGGTGVVTNNAMQYIPFNKTGIQLNVYSINRGDSIPCQTAYPAARQTGHGWSASSTAAYGTPVVPKDGIGDVTDPLYIWNNRGTETSDPSYIALGQYSPDDCGHGELIEAFLKQNRDYFVNVAMPGWTPYTYPHPLRARAVGAIGSGPLPLPGANPTPAAPPPPRNLRVVKYRTDRAETRLLSGISAP
jgi:hypothetical protein